MNDISLRTKTSLGWFQITPDDTKAVVEEAEEADESERCNHKDSVVKAEEDGELHPSTAMDLKVEFVSKQSFTDV